MSKVTEDKRHIRSRDRTKELVGIMFVPGYFILIVTKVMGAPNMTFIFRDLWYILSLRKGLLNLQANLYSHTLFFTDPKKDTSITLDGNKVTVPQGKPVNQSKFNNSSFYQSEYLVYKESQNRMRYLLEFKLYWVDWGSRNYCIQMVWMISDWKMSLCKVCYQTVKSCIS